MASLTPVGPQWDDLNDQDSLGCSSSRRPASLLWAASEQKQKKLQGLRRPRPGIFTGTLWLHSVVPGLAEIQCAKQPPRKRIQRGGVHGTSVQFSSVTQSCPTLYDPMNHSMPGLPVHHQLLEFTQTLVHWVGDAIQPSHPLSSPSPPALNLCQHQGLFHWVSSSHQVAKILEFQLQRQSFQWIFRTDLL